MHKEILILTEKRTEGFYLNRLLLMRGTCVCNAYSVDEAKERIRVRSISQVITTMGTSTIPDLGVPVHKVTVPIRESGIEAIAMRTFSATELHPLTYRELLPFWFYENCGDIDIPLGLANCGGTEGYMAALDIFYGSLDSKADEIEGFFASDDMENYNIKVHALKSSARTIGAEGLADLAADLEAASASGGEDAVRRDTGRLLEWFRSYKKSLAGIFEDQGNDEPLLPLPEGLLQRGYSDIGRYADQMDYALCEDTITMLLEYELPAEDREAVKAMLKSLEELDWDRIKELLGERRGS